jgi:hypothetical protein
MNTKDQDDEETNQASIFLKYPQINGSRRIFSGKLLLKNVQEYCNE